MLLPCRSAALGGRNGLPLAALVVMGLFGCRAASPKAERAPRPAPIAVAAAPEVAPDATPQAVPTDRKARAIALLEAGDVRGARALLDEILIEAGLAAARQALERSPEDALTAIDEVLDIAPRNPDAAYLKGRASLALAEKAIAAGGSAGPGLIEGALQDALAFFQRSNAPPESAFGATRAATLLGDWPTALDWARRGRELLASGEIDEAALDPAPLRTLAEAFFGAYVEERTTGTAPEDARGLFLEAEASLESLLGRTPEDTWVWGRLADLHEWAGDFAGAEKRAEGGLARAPEDAALLERLARVARSAGGSEHAVAVLEAHVAAAPRNVVLPWLLARERFDQIVERFVAGTATAADFAGAEESFARATELDPTRESQALPYIVICRAGRGWSAFRADDLAEAERAFLSMDEIFPQGVKWSLPGRIETGIQGLASVADRHYQLKHLEEAGRVFLRVHELEPESIVWANNAGFMLRDAGEAIDLEGQRLCAMARGEAFATEAAVALRAAAGLPAAPGDAAAERGTLVRAANERIEHASAVMEQSYTAYCDAMALAPDDVRIVNDTALILVYFLHRDLDHAEELLVACTEKGQAQIEDLRARIAAPELPTEQRDALELALDELQNAWGDAFENLGMLYLLHRHDPARARGYFERAVEIGPAPRPLVTNGFLPLALGQGDPATSDDLPMRDFGRACE